jgi:hypothetical protein
MPPTVSSLKRKKCFNLFSSCSGRLFAVLVPLGLSASYCDVAQARSYFASTVLWTGDCRGLWITVPPLAETDKGKPQEEKLSDDIWIVAWVMTPCSDHLKTEAVSSPKTLVTAYKTTRCHNPEHFDLNFHFRENPVSMRIGLGTGV